MTIPTELVARALAQTGKSDQEVADFVGVSKQAVNGWRKTGRIGTAALAKLSQLSGIDLLRELSGVQAPLPAAAPIAGEADKGESLVALVARLTPRLQRAPEHIRTLVGNALSSYAQHPEDGAKIASTIEMLLGDDP